MSSFEARTASQSHWVISTFTFLDRPWESEGPGYEGGWRGRRGVRREGWGGRAKGSGCIKKKHPVTLMFDRTAEVTCPLIINAAIHTRRATAAAAGSLWSDDDPVWPRDYNLTQISRNDTFTVCWVTEIIRRKRSSASFNEYRKSLVYDVLELRCFLVTSPSPINGSSFRQSALTIAN